MERMKRECEEIHVFGGTAERTGVRVELQGLKARPNACRSMRDLVRKYKLLGDGHFYLPVGLWPQEEESVTLGEKWLGMEKTFV